MSFADAIREPEIREILHFWRKCRKGESVPLRSAINPGHIPHRLLPYMFIYAKEKDGRYLRRLVGTALTRFYGRDDTGLYLEEILPPTAAAQRRELYDRVLETGLPAYIRGLMIMRTNEQRMCSRILLPLASRGAVADQILGLVRFGHRERPIPEAMALKALASPRQILFAAESDLDATTEVAGSEIQAPAR